MAALQKPTISVSSQLRLFIYLFVIMTIGNVTETLEMGEPISVAIGGIVSPSSFWVYPLPNLDAPEDQSINKVLQLEEVGLRTESSCPH